MTPRSLLPLGLALLLAAPAAAQDATPSPFHAGPLIPAYGQIADVDASVPIPAGTVFKVAFDTAAPGGKALNRTLESAARFLNMHAAAGVPASDLHVAIVVHGRAVNDVAVAGGAGEGAANPNAPLVAALLAHGARIIVCGQSAASLGVGRADLLPGVEMALSAMTAHALLQQQGYTLNPF